MQRFAALKKMEAGKPATGCLNAAPDTPTPKPTACLESAISVKRKYHIEQDTVQGAFALRTFQLENSCTM